METAGSKLIGPTALRQIMERASTSSMEEESTDPDPPFETTYPELFSTYDTSYGKLPVVEEEQELPLIDLSQLINNVKPQSDHHVEACKKQIAEASKEWGFFQVINHGIPSEMMELMWEEQMKMLKKPFAEKSNCKDCLNLPEGSYRWGTQTAKRLNQLSWMEAFHLQLCDNYSVCNTTTLGPTVEKFAASVHQLALKLAAVLAEQLGPRVDTKYFEENCGTRSCYLRFNRYPACPKYPGVYGIVPHTDSDFLTVLQQDNIGGLQMVKDGRWVGVKPIPNALIINIGDLFQAWSNDEYRSVEHRVVTDVEKERFSTAYFLCPSHETVIPSDVYTSFTFGDFRKQVIQDVTSSGTKIGLPMFLRSIYD